ncbi:MAG: hypothetical protein KKF89_00320 [Nanoarchaeota archaeon]|nr:hypothetical protein [Nanoarchaeota archaeon]MBU1854140.1 hypothetical protein [Nanoarchaeota archaeon]
MNEEILEALYSIGLTKGEAAVYSNLSILGTSTVGPIIDKSDVSASKVYQILDRLMTKGLVSMMLNERKKQFTALPPEILLKYLDDELEKIESNKERISSIIPILKANQESADNSPVAEFVKGERSFINITTNLVSNLDEEGTYYSLAGTRTGFKLRKYWFEHSQMISEKKQRQLVTYEKKQWVDNDPKIHRRKERKEYYPVVLAEDDLDFPNIAIYGNNTFLSDFDENGTIFGLVIRNKTLTNSFVKLLKYIRKKGFVPEGFQKAPDE